MQNSVILSIWVLFKQARSIISRQYFKNIFHKVMIVKFFNSLKYKQTFDYSNIDLIDLFHILIWNKKMKQAVSLCRKKPCLFATAIIENTITLIKA